MVADLREFDGVLTGTPVYHGSSGALMEAARPLPPPALPRTG